MKILAINPGSTSTKIASWVDGLLEKTTIDHDRNEIDRFNEIADQKAFRFECIQSVLNEKDWRSGDYDAFVGRGGFIKPVEGGVYEVNPPMLQDLETGVGGAHASNLGGILAHMFAVENKKKAYIVDPVVIDEMEDVARISGLKGIERKSFFHALNQKAVARKVARDLERPYHELNLIVVHMGGGISVGAHRRGRVIDVNNALSGDGPLSPERSGGLPLNGFCEYMQNHDCSPDEMISLISRRAGILSYTGTVDIRELESGYRKGDPDASLMLEAMVYQIAKEIGALATVLEGIVDGIVLTGGIAFSELITSMIQQRTGFIAEVFVVPGEYEMEALTDGVNRVLSGAEAAKEYR